MGNDELIIYQSNDKLTKVEVKLADETVWLNRKQIADLFNRDVKTIGKHINNAIKEELHDFSVVANFATTATDGKVYKVKYYNLDMIISIGYRVKSKQGTQFRIWANKILKEYLLKGYSFNNRINRVEDKVEDINKKVEIINLQLNSNFSPKQGVYFDGQIFDAYVFVSDIIRNAQKSIILIDNYIDETVLMLLTKRKEGVKSLIYTNNISKQLKLDLQKHNSQYPKIEIKQLKNSHDRFVIIDKSTVYHIGASIKDLGKKWFAFTKIEGFTDEILKRLG